MAAFEAGPGVSACAKVPAFHAAEIGFHRWTVSTFALFEGKTSQAQRVSQLPISVMDSRSQLPSVLRLWIGVESGTS